METLLCLDSHPTLFNFFDFSIAPPLLFYAYIPILLLSVFFGLFIYSKDKSGYAPKYFLATTIAFGVWILTVLVQWTAVSAGAVHFAWQFLILPEVAIYVFSALLTYSLLFQKDASSGMRFFSACIIALSAIVMPTSLNTESFDLINCQSNLGFGWSIVYMAELASLVLIASMGFERFQQTKIVQEKIKTTLFSAGVLVFLGTFWLSNFYGEITKTYEINLLGPIGMAIFLILMSYSILKFKTFKIKIFSTQILVVSLWILIGSLLFVDNIDYIHIIVALTCIFVFAVGIQLIVSVKKEIESREKIERLAKDLEAANAKLKELDGLKSEFLSFASHQLRNPLTAVKGYASLVLEGDYGKVDPKIIEVFKTISASTQNLLIMVQEFLDISKIEQGGMKYDMVQLDIRKLVESVIDQTKPNIETKGLTYTLTVDDSKRYEATGDETKLRQVFVNIIDNCIKYTPTGSLTMSLTRNGSELMFTITDTGVGISKEDIPKLFGKFSRATGANKINVIGSGLGLYLAKQIIEAHRGIIEVTSPGKDLGSTFVITIPAK